PRVADRNEGARSSPFFFLAFATTNALREPFCSRRAESLPAWSTLKGTCGTAIHPPRGPGRQRDVRDCHCRRCEVLEWVLRRSRETRQRRGRRAASKPSAPRS